MGRRDKVKVCRRGVRMGLNMLAAVVGGAKVAFELMLSFFLSMAVLEVKELVVRLESRLGEEAAEEESSRSSSVRSVSSSSWDDS